MPFKKMKKIIDHHLTSKFLIILLIFLAWFILSATNWAKTSPNNMWMASPQEVIKACIEIFSSEFSNVLASFQRVIVAVLFVLISGLIGGLLIGYNSSLYNSLKPILDFWRSIPPIVVIPILIYWDTSNDKENWRIMLVLFGCFPILTMLIAESIDNASKKRLAIFQSLNAKTWFKIRNVIVYEILPNLFIGIRTLISFAIVIIIVSEMVVSPEKGIGSKILHYKSAYEIQFVYAYAIILGLIGFLLNFGIRKLEQKLIKWN